MRPHASRNEAVGTVAHSALKPGWSIIRTACIDSRDLPIDIAALRVGNLEAFNKSPSLSGVSSQPRRRSAPVLVMSFGIVAVVPTGLAFDPPKNAHTLLYAFAILDFIALVGMLVLLIVGICTKRIRSNLVLLNFQFVIFLTAAGQTFMIWTGHSSDMIPPVPLCSVSGAFIAAGAAAKAGAAFGLTGKVRGRPYI
jgi:hypothetical protein